MPIDVLCTSRYAILIEDQMNSANPRGLVLQKNRIADCRGLIAFLLLLLFIPLTAEHSGAQGPQQNSPGGAAQPPSESQRESVRKLVPLSSAVGRTDTDASDSELGEGPEFLQRREEWFFQPRAFPLGFVPAGARLKALEEMHRITEFTLGPRLSTLNSLLQPPLSGPGAPAWQPVGPNGTNSPFFAPFTSGRVTALSVDLVNPNIVYLGAADGGLWKTTDGGATWIALTDSQLIITGGAVNVGSIAVGSIAIDPTSCSGGFCTTIYVGTGEANFAGDNVYGEGVLKSTDAGATWTHDNTFTSSTPISSRRLAPRIGAIDVNPANGQILLAGVSTGTVNPAAGIYRSTNGGMNWTGVGPSGGPAPTSVQFDPSNPSTAYAGVTCQLSSDPTCFISSSGIYKSTDVGQTWRNITPASINPARVGRIALAIAPFDSRILYAAIADGSQLLGVFRSTDGGISWTQLTDPLVNNRGFCNPQCFYDLAIAVSPAKSGGKAVVYAGGAANNATVIRTLDDGTPGTAWVEASRRSFARPDNPDSLHVDTHAFAFSKDGGVLYVGNDGGVWKTGDPAGSVGANFWSNLNAGLGITQFFPGHTIHPSTALKGFGGTQDNGIQIYNGNPIWTDAGIGCDGGYTAIDSQIPSNVYVECEYIPNVLLIIAISIENGDFLRGRGFLARSGINPTDRGAFIPPLVIDGKNPQVLYFGTCRVWQTTTEGESWTPISPDVTSTAHQPGCPEPRSLSDPSGTVTTIAIAPDSNTIYAGSSNGEIEVRLAGSAAWTSLTTNTLPVRAVTKLAVDPMDSKIAYATFSGFGSCAVCDRKGHVFKTINATLGPSTVWMDISGTANRLPDIPVNSILIDPDDPARTLFAGTDIGVFVTTDSGMNWALLGKPNTLAGSVVMDLVLHEPSRTLRAVTHGRGVWDLNLGGQAAFGITSISPFTANAAGSDITNFTVNGNGFTANSKIQFAINGTTLSLPTTMTGPNQLVGTIPGTNLQFGNLAQVSVVDSALTSNRVPFTLLSPAPNLTSLSPATQVARANPNGFVLTAMGAGFNCGPNKTFIVLDGTARQTLSCSTTSLTAQVTAMDQSFGHIFVVDVFTPQPGGGPQIESGLPLILTSPAGSDFTLTTGASTAAVTAGASANYEITVTSQNGFGDRVILSCVVTTQVTVQPQFNPTCVANPSPVTPGANAPTSKLTITTFARSAAPPASLAIRPWRMLPLPLLALLISTFTAWVYCARRMRLGSFASGAFALLILLAILELGCGGGGSGTTPPPPTGTTAGQYAVTVTGTSGTISHSLPLTLTVN